MQLKSNQRPVQLLIRGFAYLARSSAFLCENTETKTWFEIYFAIYFVLLFACHSLPKVVKRRVNALKNLQVKCAHIEAKFYEEVHELERKYAALYQPLFDKVRCLYTLVFTPNVFRELCSSRHVIHHDSVFRKSPPTPVLNVNGHHQS